MHLFGHSAASMKYCNYSDSKICTWMRQFERAYIAHPWLTRAPLLYTPATMLTVNNKKILMTSIDSRRFTTNSSYFSRQTSGNDFLLFTPKKNKFRAKNARRLIYQRFKFICAIELCANIRKCRLEDNFVCAGIITSRIWCRCLRRYCKTINWWMWHYWPRTTKFMPIKLCFPHAVHTFRWDVTTFSSVLIKKFALFWWEKIMYSQISVAVHT